MKPVLLSLLFVFSMCSAVFSQEMFVTASNLNVRDAPEGNRIDGIPYGMKVTVSEEKNGWAYIQYGLKVNVIEDKNGWAHIEIEKKKGWVSLHYLTQKPTDPKERYVATSRLNVRNTPGGRITDGLPKGAKVKVTKESKGWACILYGERKGWVRADYLTPSFSD